MRCLLALLLLLIVGPAWADGLRLAVRSADLSRNGPGLLLRDLRAGTDPGLAAGLAELAGMRADVLLLCGVDWDHGGLALAALATALAQAGGPDYPHRLALRPNAGLPTGLDLDGDGRRGGPGDAQGFGAFTGQGGMALLSRLPLGAPADHSARLWRDLPGGLAGDLPEEQAELRRLSSTGHWEVPLALPDGRRLMLMAWCAGPPAFGRGDENVRRNHDETAFWSRRLDGALGPPPGPPFVLLGSANLDPDRGDGRHEAIRALLADPRLQDPRPAAADGSLATADWTQLRSGRPGPGRLRTEYILPSRDIAVTGARLIPPPGPATHGTVIVDLALPSPG